MREAEAAYQTALRLRPSEEGAFAGLTFETGVEQIMLDEVKQIEAEVRQKPNSADAHLRLALACAYAGNDAEARQEIQRSIELKPSNGPAHLVQARLDYLRGQYAAADTELHAAKAAGVTPRLDFVNAIHRKLGRQPAN